MRTEHTNSNDWWMVGLFFVIVGLHIFIALGNILAFFITPFLAPWYEALPICSFVLLISFSQELKGYDIYSTNQSFPPTFVSQNIEYSGLTAHWAEFIFGVKTVFSE